MSDFLDKAKADQAEGSKDGDKKYPPTWKPEPGDQMAGVVADVSWPFVPAAEEHRWLLTVDPDDGERTTVWCSSAVLKRLIVDVMPAIGAEIVITYDGKGKTKAGYDVGLYQMATSKVDTALYAQIVRDARERDTVQAEMYDGSSSGGAVTAAAEAGDPLEAPF